LNRGFACHRWFDSLIGVVATIRKRGQQSIDFSALLKCRLKFAFLALRLVPRLLKTHI
jgi:hypothetical protein